jgi:hypothetical protein
MTNFEPKYVLIKGNASRLYFLFRRYAAFGTLMHWHYARGVGNCNKGLGTSAE